MVTSLVRRDPELRERVVEELRWDSRVDEAGVGIAVHEGVVTLSGTVGSFAERRAAQEAAHRVAGVQDVANGIRVKLPGSHVRTDEDIARAVRNALEWNVLLPADAIRSTVSDGWVTLEGDVNSWRQRMDAEAALLYLPGVQGIENKTRIQANPVNAIELRRAIAEALERRADREAKHLRVVIEGNTVTIAGKVRTWLDKQAILGQVGHAPGIQAVLDQLEIDPLA